MPTYSLLAAFAAAATRTPRLPTGFRLLRWAAADAILGGIAMRLQTMRSAKRFSSVSGDDAARYDGAIFWPLQAGQ